MPLSNADKKRCRAALDILETKQLQFDWGTNWASVHDGNTSQLGGLKPGSRRDSAAPRHYWVGLFNSRDKRLIAPPLVEASFANPPTTAEAVEALRAEVDNSW